MLRAFLSRSRPARPAEAESRAPNRLGASRPPQEFAHRAWPSRLGDWLGASGWRVSMLDLPAASFGQRARLDAARLDFAEALFDIHTAAAAIALDRIAVTRSLHELWHFRGEVFGHVSRRHDQGEAEQRLAMLDRHFASRSARQRLRLAIGPQPARPAAE